MSKFHKVKWIFYAKTGAVYFGIFFVLLLSKSIEISNLK